MLMQKNKNKGNYANMVTLFQDVLRQEVKPILRSDEEKELV